ncbi:MAG TPA: ABC transporter permease [Opitutaceae bacterium]|nr:ABC transporter permease [Opitutaceae bacterium]
MSQAIRQLLKSPGFTALAIVTLALGIGLNTSMFSLMNLLLLQPLPYPQKDQLVRIYRTTPQSPTGNFNVPDALDVRHAIRDVSHFALYRMWSFSLAFEDRPPVNLNALRVSADFFPALGLRPELGRFFTADEDRPGNHVIVLSHATWQAQFGGDPGIIGRTVRVDGEPTTVVGVLPPEFSSVFLWGPGDAIRPLALTDAERVDRNDTGIQVLGRLNGHTALGPFNGQLDVIARDLAKTRPREESMDGMHAVTLQESIRSAATVRLSWMLVGLAAFVLLIACANLANLQLARTIARSQEFAIRAALGASRFRLLQPVLIESLLLAFSGGAVGVLVAAWTNSWMSSRMSANGVVNFHFTIDWRVLLFALGVSVVTGVAFGLVPAFLLSQVRVNDTLKSGTRGNTGSRTQSRIRHTLIVGQFALALVLLATAGLFIHAFNRMLTREVGWDRRQIVQGVVSLPGAKYSTPQKIQAFYDRVQERLRTLPGVENVAVGWTLPVFQFLTTRSYVVEGRDAPPAGREPIVAVNGVTPSYLPTLNIKLLAGRNFADTDTLQSPPVVIINASLAHALFGNENPVGHRLGTTDPSNRGWAQIVGVMPDLRFAMTIGVQQTPFVVFRPLAQEPWGYVTIAVRASSPSSVAEPFRRTIAEIDPDLPLQQFGSIDDLVRNFGGGYFMVRTVLIGFAMLGLFLAAVGLYGVVTRLVAQRMPELGIRIALGAQGRDVVWLILRTGLVLACIGTAVGLTASFGMAHLINANSADFPMQDPWIILGVAALLLGVALFASWIPALRASRIDPLVALRSD